MTIPKVKAFERSILPPALLRDCPVDFYKRYAFSEKPFPGYR